MAPYAATKFAVVGYSESLKQELEDDGIGVSVLCPGWVATNIYNTQLKRPSGDANAKSAMETDEFKATTGLVDAGLPAAAVGELAVESMIARRFYIFTAPEMRPIIDIRRDQIQTDYEACLKHLNNAKVLAE